MDKVAVVSHDAGAAEILSSWVNRTNNKVYIAASGPAEKIFKNKCPNEQYFTLEKAIVNSNWILCGTSWQSNFERLAIIAGRAQGKRTIVFLDHWVNYKERFVEDGITVIPDEIWVGDQHAERIARSQFKNIQITLKTNPYTEDMLAEIANAQSKKPRLQAKKILYVCEPIAAHALKQYGDEHYLGYTEHEALYYFLENINLIEKTVESIVIRPHPSEEKKKYSWILELETQKIKFSSENLIKETLEADIVVGCESMAMVVALLAKKRVISSIPPGGRSCQLPHQEIEQIQLLIRNKKK
jgi:hypothetical protein